MFQTFMESKSKYFELEERFNQRTAFLWNGKNFAKLVSGMQFCEKWISGFLLFEKFVTFVQFVMFSSKLGL